MTKLLIVALRRGKEPPQLTARPCEQQSNLRGDEGADPYPPYYLTNLTSSVDEKPLDLIFRHPRRIP
jgi:hypothetical protein